MRIRGSLLTSYVSRFTIHYGLLYNLGVFASWWLNNYNLTDKAVYAILRLKGEVIKKWPEN